MHITSGWRVALAIVLAAGALSWTAPTAAQDDPRQDAAASLYKIAQEEFAAENYQEALDKLTEVQKLDPNPVILYNIGRCYEELGQLADAAEFFQAAAADKSLPEGLYAEVGRRLPKLMPALRLREARILVAATVANGLQRGEEHALQAYVNTRQVVSVTPVGPEPVYLWSGVAVAGAGVVLVGIGAITDLGLSDPIDELKDPATRRDAARTGQLQDEIDSGQTLALSMYLAGAAAVVAGGVLVGLGFLEPEEAADASAWRIGPAVGPGVVGVQMGGWFP